MDRKRICKICGTEYEYCTRCGQDKDKPSWMFLVDKEECHLVFQTLSNHFNKSITDEQAVEALKDIDINIIQNESIANQLKALRDKVNPVKEVKEEKEITVDKQVEEVNVQNDVRPERKNNKYYSKNR